MSLLTWSIIILIGLFFLIGLAYIVWAVVVKIRLSRLEKGEDIDLLDDLYERGESPPDEDRKRMRDSE